MHLAVNALPIHQGGGLTVALGVVNSLRAIAPDWKLTVLTSNESTDEAIVPVAGQENVSRILPNANSAMLYAWQNLRLGTWLKQKQIDAILNINHYVHNLECPQVVYHLNLLRFQKPTGFTRGISAIGDLLRDRSARNAVRYGDLNVFESTYLQRAAESACRCPARNGHVIYIGLPDELIDLSHSHRNVSPSTRRIASITSPADHKDNETLIRVLAELVSRHPGEPWALDIAGGANPEVWNPLKRLATELRVDDRITWHGFCSQEKLTTILSSALCLVSTSLVESFAMVALEAMARGCPPIVSNCASMPESIGNAGLLAQPRDPVSFAQAVWSLAISPARRERMVQLGNEWIDGFRWNNCGREFVRLISSLKASKSTAEVRSA